MEVSMIGRGSLIYLPYQSPERLSNGTCRMTRLPMTNAFSGWEVEYIYNIDWQFIYPTLCLDSNYIVRPQSHMCELRSLFNSKRKGKFADCVVNQRGVQDRNELIWSMHWASTENWAIVETERAYVKQVYWKKSMRSILQLTRKWEVSQTCD